MALRKETTGTRENMGPSPPGPGGSVGKRKSLVRVFYAFGITMGWGTRLQGFSLAGGPGPLPASPSSQNSSRSLYPVCLGPGEDGQALRPHTHTHQGQQPYCTEALGRELGPCDGESPWKHASGHVYKSLSHRARKVHPECGGTNSGAVPSNRKGEQLTQALSSKPRRTSGWIKALLAKVLE